MGTLAMIPKVKSCQEEENKKTPVTLAPEQSHMYTHLGCMKYLKLNKTIYMTICWYSHNLLVLEFIFEHHQTWKQNKIETPLMGLTLD